MTLRRKIDIVFALFVLGCIIAYSATSGGAARISQRDRICTSNADCAVLMVGCGCCGGGGHNDSVNVKAFEDLKKLSVCTEKQRATCAVTNCAVTSTPTAVCIQGSCAIQYVPNNK